MEQYELETKIRQLVAEISAPGVVRGNQLSIIQVQQCLAILKDQQEKYEALEIKYDNVNKSIAQIQFNQSLRFNDLDIQSQTVKRIEQEFYKSQANAQQSLLQQKNMIEVLQQDNKNIKSHQEHISSYQVKLQSEQSQYNDKLQQMSDQQSQTMNNFFKEIFEQFIDTRNSIQTINKDFIYMKKQLAIHGKDIQQLMEDCEKCRNTRQTLQNKIDLLQQELNQYLLKDIFTQKFDGLEQVMLEQNNTLANRLKKLSELNGNQIESLDERMELLEKFEIQYRQALNGQQQNLNLLGEEFRVHAFDYVQKINKFSDEISTFSNQLNGFEAKFQDQFQYSINQLQLNIKKQIAALSSQFDEIKTQTFKKLNQEVQLMMDLQKQTIIEESIKKSQHFYQESQQFQKQGRVREIIEVRSIEVQVNIEKKQEINVDVLQDLIERTLENNYRSLSLTSKQNLVSSNRKISSQVNTIQNAELVSISSNKQEDQINNQQYPESVLINIQKLQSQLEDLIQKIDIFEQEFNLGITKFDKNNNILLKWRSDIYNDNEYLNNQVKILLREKEYSNKKLIQLTQIISCCSEAIFLLLSNQLVTSREPIKYGCKSIGQVIETKMDSVFYRGVLLSNDDMFKRGILGIS
ncbi:hypothetical protein pb186bvf_000499 [Paramecium bursaria]